jgi:hypothetical protein
MLGGEPRSPSLVTRAPQAWDPRAGSGRDQGIPPPAAPQWVLTDLDRGPFVTLGMLEAGPREAPERERRAAGSVVAESNDVTES